MRPVLVVSLLAAVAAFMVVLELVRRRQLPAKYAGLWLLLGLGAVVTASVPSALGATARVLHVYDPVNLLLFGAVMFLVLICLQLCRECGRLEEETRTLAEQLALLRLEVLDARRPPAAEPASTPTPNGRADGR